MTVVTKKKIRHFKPGAEFVLDSDVVPTPERKPTGAHRIYFPFDVLEVGRSFTTRRGLDTVRKAIRRYREESGMEREYTARALDNGGSRAWRTK